ncbi:CMP-sialic acid transporter-like [Raphidocelis subcapitata]|uniref:CMP-sialic acid transporter-like n=1 Tax=Raphidocelis subcapitata TaxID=307507 RepID=A0A2V0P216_9CHLO|nr:CMP-sialic acid transporter-like [Raphidocelis subcapitata]|eukprot:GBF93921.1 CMP-sialic acid transporter-like [Raphidocelis subcapitata]
MGIFNGGAKRHAFEAYQEPLNQQAAQRANAFKIALVASDCVLLGMQPVLVHMSKNAEGQFSFNPMILQTCSGGREALPPGALIPAMLCVAGSVTVPSAASVYNEFALKKHMETSVHLQNFFLYFYGVLFNLAGVLITGLFEGGRGFEGLFEGLGPVTTLIIVNNAAQGILSSFFYKFADTILKKYSSTLATIFTALMSWGMFGHALTANFALGVSIVFVSMHQFFTFGEKKGPPPPTSPPPGEEPTSPVSPAALPIKALAGGAQWRSAMLLHSPSMEHFRVEPAQLRIPGNGGGGNGYGGSGNGYGGGGGGGGLGLPREGSFLGRDRSFMGGSGMFLSREGSFVPGGARLQPLPEDAGGGSGGDGGGGGGGVGAPLMDGPPAAGSGEAPATGARAPLLPR